ncbi:MAG: putative FecR, partial [candidate division NC10 bacterium]|nr:putative FecR [candidate division NC10 bacterium]
MSEDRLDQVLNEMRKDNVPAEELAAARARVWDKLAGAEPELCTEFRASFQDYLADGLESPRRLLMQDHLSRCATCRRALAEFQSPRRVVPMPAVVRRMTLPVWSRWAIAAGVAALALYLARGPIDKSMAPSGPRATVIAASGSLYQLPQGAVVPGDFVEEGEVIRTGYGGHAVLQLTDGSRVEVNERTELSLQATWSGETIRLERGDVIVQAAKQHRGRLRVVTRDSVASVKGTVFAVSAGLAGSVVAVVEGSVQVTQPAGRRLLTRGQRAASSSALEDVPVRRTVAWSENAAKYAALLGELAQIGKTVAATSTPAPRTQPKLLPYLPAGTFVYIAVPNLGPAVQQAVNLIEQRAQENTVVKEWWASADKEGLKLLAEKVQALSPLIGDEVVFVVARPLLATTTTTALLAEVQPGREDALKQALAQAIPEAKVAYQVSDKLLVISDSPEHLGVIVAGMGQGATIPFAAEIANHYQEGVNILFALDASSVANLQLQKNEAAAITGANKLKYLFFEERSVQGKDEVRAAVVFGGPRTGVASWLGSPGPAGSAGYVSSDA